MVTLYYAKFSKCIERAVDADHGIEREGCGSNYGCISRRGIDLIQMIAHRRRDRAGLRIQRAGIECVVKRAFCVDERLPEKVQSSVRVLAEWHKRNCRHSCRAD